MQRCYFWCRIPCLKLARCCLREFTDPESTYGKQILPISQLNHSVRVNIHWTFVRLIQLCWCHWTHSFLVLYVWICPTARSWCFSAHLSQTINYSSTRHPSLPICSYKNAEGGVAIWARLFSGFLRTSWKWNCLYMLYSFAITQWEQKPRRVQANDLILGIFLCQPQATVTCKCCIHAAASAQLHVQLCTHQQV